MKINESRAQVSVQDDRPDGPREQSAQAEPATNNHCPRASAAVHPPGSPIVHHQRLPYCAATQISRRLRVAHPRKRGGDTVMTTDVLLPPEAPPTEASMAVAIIDPKEFVQMLRQKRLIEQSCWQARGVEFRIITKESIDRDVSKTLGFESYWRAEHQLAGLAACPKHGASAPRGKSNPPRRGPLAKAEIEARGRLIKSRAGKSATPTTVLSAKSLPLVNNRKKIPT